jgi:gluconolactonase
MALHSVRPGGSEIISLGGLALFSCTAWLAAFGMAQTDPATIASDGRVEKVAGGFIKSEGPVWVKEGYLLFSDFEQSRIFRLTPPNVVTPYLDHTGAANGNSMDVLGRLYSCERDGRRVVRRDGQGNVTVIADRWDGKKLNSPNDVAVRRDGQVYFTDPASAAVKEPQELGFNGVYHVSPSGSISLITKSMERPNGVALSPDGRILYVADSSARTIEAFDLDERGNSSSQRVLIQNVDGSPDGLRVSERGNLYIACRGIAVYSPTGKLLRTIDIPEQPANCAFGDPDLQSLYVTARSSLYRIRVPEKGSLQY